MCIFPFCPIIHDACYKFVEQVVRSLSSQDLALSGAWKQQQSRLKLINWRWKVENARRYVEDQEGLFKNTHTSTTFALKYSEKISILYRKNIICLRRKYIIYLIQTVSGMFTQFLLEYCYLISRVSSRAYIAYQTHNDR